MPIVCMDAMRQAFFRDAGAQYGDIVYFSQQSREVIDRRLKELDEEWDVERAIEAASRGAVAGAGKGGDA